MKCDEWNHLLSSYIEGNCLRKEEAEQHLAECAACRAQLEETQKIAALCRDMSEVPLPEGFSERLHERLMQEAKPKKVPIFRLQQYKRGFAIGAAVVAASMVFVATPFFRLYDESGNVPHITEENTIQNGAKEVPHAEPEEPLEPPTVVAGTEAEIGEEPRRTAKPVVTPEEPQAETPIRQAETASEVQAVQPTEQPITSAEPQPVQKADAAEPSTVTEPSVQNAEVQPEIGTGGAVPFVASRVGGSGGAAAVNAEPTFAVLADTAENRAWVRENVSGYDSRISADGAEIVTLTEDEYLTCLYDGPAAAEEQELPQAVAELLEADGYYLILK